MTEHKEPTMLDDGKRRKKAASTSLRCFSQPVDAADGKPAELEQETRGDGADSRNHIIHNNPAKGNVVKAQPCSVTGRMKSRTPALNPGDVIISQEVAEKSTTVSLSAATVRFSPQSRVTAGGRIVSLQHTQTHTS